MTDLTEIKRLLAEATQRNDGVPDSDAKRACIHAVLNAAPAMIEELERLRSDNEALREAIRPIASCHLPPSGYEQVGVTAHFTADQIRTAKAAIAQEEKR